ncbi:MAG: hypothetical protein DMG61_15885 [Acidobacteria bacterium]|nr:MAG: hypothetical protein DMG61_15885 [Acidobacteriota bacterium]PYY15448.1 MAG: hypothetical protein DMG60_17620 [Acidobacteriota bacterium]
MNSRLIVGLLIAVGIAVLVLLITPTVHVPYIVVHGPMTALRAQRAAALFNALMGAGALLFVGLFLHLGRLWASPQQGIAPVKVSNAPHLSCTLRC